MAEQKNLTIRQWIDTVKPVATWILIVAILVQCAWSSFAHFVLFPTGILQSLYYHTGSILHPTFTGYVLLSICTGFLLCYIGGLRAKDFAIFHKQILPAVGFTLLAWAIIQLSPLLNGHSLEILTAWNEDGYSARKFSRFFVGQLFGNALYEELFYRGFLISQFTLLFRKKFSMTKAVIFAVIFSQIIFAVIHIPHRIVNEIPLVESIVRTFFNGIIFASLFLLTKNIFAVTGLHALWNASPNLFEHSVDKFGTTGLLIILLSILLCKCIYRKCKHKDKVDQSKSFT